MLTFLYILNKKPQNNVISCHSFRDKRLKVKFFGGCYICLAFNYSKLEIPCLQNIKKWIGRIPEASEEKCRGINTIESVQSTLETLNLLQKMLRKKVSNQRNNPSLSSETAVIIFDARKPSWSQGMKYLTTPKLTKATKKKS